MWPKTILNSADYDNRRLREYDPEKIVASYIIAAVCQLCLLMKAVRVYEVNAVSWLDPCAFLAKSYSVSSKRFYVSLTDKCRGKDKS